jgi:Mycothiol maleylpyruvate isomerase N-terminal domain
VIDTRPFFRPLSQEFVAILRELPPRAWDSPTAAGSWTVRDVLAHLVDGMMRRLSFHRDRMPPPPPRPIAGERDFVAFINECWR